VGRDIQADQTKENDMKAMLIAVALAALLAPAAQAQNEKFVPGYTDFPNALRVEARMPPDGFTPGHSDFPNHLRVDSAYDRARTNSGADGQVVVIAEAKDRSFDWADAGIGAGGAAGVLLLAAGMAAIAVRRPVRKTALTG
jgi:hypothetical protein